VEDNGVGNKELLVAGSDKRYRKIHGKMQHVLKDEE